jgi:CheY-like chemotaxis protein
VPRHKDILPPPGGLLYLVDQGAYTPAKIWFIIRCLLYRSENMIDFPRQNHSIKISTLLLQDNGEEMDERHTKQILLVEDEALIAMTKKLALEKYGYSVLTVGTGERAVEILGRSPGIDLILMDIDLGKGMDGTRAAELILQEHDLPVVFLSSHTEPEVVEKTEKITSYGYVVKSSTITVLDASIKMAFKLFDANRRLTEELKERKRIEHNLSHAQMSWESTFNSMNDIVSMISVDHRFMAINQAGVQSLNMAKEKIIGRKCYEIVHGTSAPIEQCPCTRALESGKEEVSEFYDGKTTTSSRPTPCTMKRVL